VSLTLTAAVHKRTHSRERALDSGGSDRNVRIECLEVRLLAFTGACLIKVVADVFPRTGAICKRVPQGIGTGSSWGKRKLHPVRQKLGLPRITLHCFRHSHSTQLNALGTDPKTLQSQLRHASPEITLGRYTHQVPELQRRAVQQLEDSLFEAEETTSQLFSNVLN
jgi:integrase